jgi:signal transduction histidine kinase
VLLSGSAALIAVVAAVLSMMAVRAQARTLEFFAELEESRARELDAFAAQVSHDLMNPLAGVAVGLGGIAKRHDDEPTKEMAKRATRSLTRARDLVASMLAFARSGGHPARSATANLKQAVQAAVDEVRAVEGEGAPQVDTTGVEDCRVACDPSVLAVVVSNLVSNAAKYTHGRADRRVTVRSACGPGRVHVEVEDNGPGIAPGALEGVFRPYGRAPDATAPGLGPGLATVQRFVTGYGGSVGARNGAGGGALFWFDLARPA